jgi:hypothetical protein
VGPFAVALRGALGGLGRLSDDAIRAGSRRLFARSWARFEAACERPRETQEARLRALLERAEATAFGREHGFEAIRDLEGYRARVPVRDFEGFRPWLDRAVAGETGVLAPESPSFFGRSSGTTGAPKLIPVSPAYRAEYRRPRRVWARQVVEAFPGLVRGRVLSVHSPRVDGWTEAGVPFGSVTVGLSTQPGRPEAALRDGVLDAVPREVFALEDFELKYHLALRFAAQVPVSLLAAINPSTLVLLLQTLDAHAASLIDDLERGTFARLDDVPEPARGRLARRLLRAPQAARRLADARAGAHVDPRRLWPELVGAVCWKGGSAPFYLHRLERWLPGLPVMDYGYLATEGGFAFPLAPEAQGSVVAVLGHVLEFVPAGDAERGDFSSAVLADALEVGARYRVLVTGAHGLYRYDINDVVRCTGYYRNTAEIAFEHKGGHMLSVTGEKVAEAHVVAAADRAARALGVELSGVSAEIELGDPPRYLWRVEGPLEAGALEPLLGALEAELRAENLEYAAKRDSLRLGAPQLVEVPAGAFAAERARRVAAGAPDAHVKPPHLSRDPELGARLGEVRRWPP